MNAILGYAQLMQRDPALPPDCQDKLNTINRSGQHLLALIEDVLEMSRSRRAGCRSSRFVLICGGWWVT